MKTLVIKLKNKDRKKLQRLQEWILSALEDWEQDNELPMKGTTCETEWKDERAQVREND